MATEIILPKFGFTLEESQLVSWLKQAGETVEVGDPIAEVTTDKVNMEVEATAEGTLAGLQFQEGEMVPVTAVMAYILAPGEKLPEQKINKPKITPVAARVAQAEGIDIQEIQGSGPGGRITRRDVTPPSKPPAPAATPTTVTAAGTKISATPAARRLAGEHQISLGNVEGRGPNGRIQKANVAEAIARMAKPGAANPSEEIEPGLSGTRILFSTMRRTIAQNMQRSKQQAPHVPFQIDVDMTAVLALTRQANAMLHGGEDLITVTAVLTKATAWALLRHPILNSHVGEDEWLQFSQANVGIAVALPEGLIVPVIHRADEKGINELAQEIKAVAQRARSNKLRPADLQNGTFTISNLGMFGIDRFTAVINPPQVGILAVGQTKKQVVVDDQDQPIVRPICTLTLSVDHRVVDGAVAARFLADLSQVLQAPGLLSL